MTQTKQQVKHPAEHPQKEVMEKKAMVEHRCNSCNHLLMNHKITAGAAEIKCSKCGTINRFEAGVTTK